MIMSVTRFIFVIIAVISVNINAYCNNLSWKFDTLYVEGYEPLLIKNSNEEDYCYLISDNNLNEISKKYY